MGLLSVGLRWIRGHTDLWHVRRGVIMWKLALILVLAAVLGQGTARNLHRLARQANDLARNPDCPACDCRTHQRKTHVVVHWPRRHAEPPCACCGCGDRFVHMHMKKKDIFHENAVPGAEMWAKGKETFATCKIIPGSREELSGTIYMKHDLMGKGPVSAHFDISGFDESADHTAHHGHEHHFQISWYTYGDAANACAHTGRQFNLPPPDKPSHHVAKDSAHNDHGDHDDDDCEQTDDDYDDCKCRQRARGGQGGHGGRHNDDPDHQHHDDDGHGRRHADKLTFGVTSGDLGNLECDPQGTMAVDKEFFNFSLVGLHSVYGRSITIRTAGEPDSAPLAYCTIAHASGEEHWGYDDSQNKWLKTEKEPGAEGAVEDDESHHGHDHHKHRG